MAWFMSSSDMFNNGSISALVTSKPKSTTDVEMFWSTDSGSVAALPTFTFKSICELFEFSEMFWSSASVSLWTVLKCRTRFLFAPKVFWHFVQGLLSWIFACFARSWLLTKDLFKVFCFGQKLFYLSHYSCSVAGLFLLCCYVLASQHVSFQVTFRIKSFRAFMTKVFLLHFHFFHFWQSLQTRRLLSPFAHFRALPWHVFSRSSFLQHL